MSNQASTCGSPGAPGSGWNRKTSATCPPLCSVVTLSSIQPSLRAPADLSGMRSGSPRVEAVGSAVAEPGTAVISSDVVAVAAGVADGVAGITVAVATRVVVGAGVAVGAVVDVTVGAFDPHAVTSTASKRGSKSRHASLGGADFGGGRLSSLLFCGVG